MPLISIIVPVYNVEKTLHKCISSILAQTVTSFELILVNDGSEDNSLFICNEFSKADSRIKVIDQNNQGVSVARNVGLAKASGEYVSFVDGDDWVEKNFLEELLRVRAEYNADISICSMMLEYPDGTANRMSSASFRLMTSEDAIECMLKDYPFGGYMMNRLYRKDYFDGLCFNKEIAVCEDTLISIDLFCKSKIIVFIPEPLYYYYLSGESVTTRGFSEKTLTSVKAKIMICDKIADMYPKLTDLAFSNLLATKIDCCVGTIIQKNKQWDDVFKVLKSSIRKSMVKGLLNSHLTIRKKIWLLLILLPRCITGALICIIKSILNSK